MPLYLSSPPWRAIYHQDAERKQSFSLAMETYRMMRSIYTSCGYKLITIPKLSVENRANILLQHIKNQQT
ncbi:AAA family ATPase [Olivibacter sp. 47]|uniref:AAA family ATPase n=1 Tax=Olivibacter sp. 47 TaxID=3056486 RepID=UPI00338D9F46